MSDCQHLVDSLHLTLGVANVKCQLIRDGASGDPVGGAVYVRRVKHAARLWARRAKSQGRNPLARLMIREGRQRALEVAPRLVTESADEIIHMAAAVALHIADSQIAAMSDIAGADLDVDLAPIIQSFTDGDLTPRQALAEAVAAVRQDGNRPDGQRQAATVTGWTAVLVYVRDLLILLVSPIFMVPLQKRFAVPPRPKSHLLAFQALGVLVAQAVFVGVVGGGGRLQWALIALFGWQALGLVALLRAPSVEFEAAFKDQVVTEEWYKDSLWQGAAEWDIEETRRRVDRIEPAVKELRRDLDRLLPVAGFDIRGRWRPPLTPDADPDS